MKHIICAIFALSLISFVCYGQTNESDDNPANALTKTQIDSIAQSMASVMMSLMPPRYKLYRTENMYTFIKLDTATGAVWQVQYGIKQNEKERVYIIDDTSLLNNYEMIRPGRFELYPTDNLYTFILLDTENGYVYHVQWHFDKESRFRYLFGI